MTTKEDRKRLGRWTALPLLLAVATWWTIAIFPASAAHAIDIVVSGDWSASIDENDLEAGAGTDLRDPLESASAQAYLDIANTSGAEDQWSVEVSKSDSFWPAGLSVYVRRTSDGDGDGSVSGGTSYMNVTESDQAFFGGTGDRTGISVQVKLVGVSLEILPDFYQTILTYQVVEQ